MEEERSGDATVNIDVSNRESPWLETGYDIQIIDPQGRHSCVPVCRAVMQIGAARGKRQNDIRLDGEAIADRQAALHYQKDDEGVGRVVVTNLSPSSPASKAGKTFTLTDWNLDEEICLGGFRLKLVRHEEGLAHLEGYSNPYRGRRWVLNDGSYPIGRPGKRENHVQLEDMTVSRAHATIEHRAEEFWVNPDSESIPIFINGQRINQAHQLQDGDLLQFGLQILRFRRARPKTPASDLHTHKASIFFADIWNYAHLTESRPLDELIRQVGEFYELVDRVIREQQGLLTSYLGDSIIALFGAGSDSPPEGQAQRAVRAAQQLQQEMKELNRGWLSQGLPPFRVGIGIHTGEVVLGDISLQGKSELAAIGGQANLAAAIEKLARDFDSQILVSQFTAAEIHDVTVKSVGRVPFEAFEQPVELFDVQVP